MKITKLQLLRFRQFSDTTFDLNDLTLLAGANNSGKTTVLWAIKAFFDFCRNAASEHGGKIQFRNHYVHARDFIPIPQDVELWHEKQTGQNNPVKISVTLENGWSATITLKAQFGQIHVSYQGSPFPSGVAAAEMLNVLKQELAFIPGLVGVLVQEPFSTPARRHSLAAEGRYAEIFRSSVFQLAQNNMEGFNSLNTFLKELFDIELLEPQFDPEKHEFVVSRFSKKGNDYEIVESGSGVQQVIQLFAYLYLVEPKIILVDEPDAHLHPSIQASLAAGLARIQTDLSAQLLIATHSYDIIDYFPPSQIVIVDSSQSKNSSLTSDQDRIDRLTKVGIIANSALIRLNSSRYSLILEDEITQVFQGFDRVLQTGVTERYSIRSAKGVSQFGNQKEIVEAVGAVLQKEVTPTFIQDREGLPDSWIAELQSLASNEGIKLNFLKRHEIENYLLDPGLITKALRVKGIAAKNSDLTKLLRDAAEEIRYEWPQTLRDRAKHVNNILKALPGRVHKSPDAVVKEMDAYLGALDTKIATILKTYPGKELLPKVRKRIQDKWKISLSNEDIYSQADKTTCPEIYSILSNLAAAASGAP